MNFMWNDLADEWNNLTWNDLTMERNDRIPKRLILNVICLVGFSEQLSYRKQWLGASNYSSFTKRM